MSAGLAPGSLSCRCNFADQCDGDGAARCFNSDKGCDCSCGCALECEGCDNCEPQGNR